MSLTWMCWPALFGALFATPAFQSDGNGTAAAKVVKAAAVMAAPKSLVETQALMLRLRSLQLPNMAAILDKVTASRKHGLA
ncbi:MAG TPA: hypothetical protein VIO33_08260 [Burkholderiaceae bacterium]